MNAREAIELMNERLSLAEKRDAKDDSPAMTLVARSCRGWPVRPKVVDHKPNGEKVYLLTVKQVRRWRDLLEAHSFDLEEGR